MSEIWFKGLHLHINDIVLTQTQYEKLRNTILLELSSFFNGKTIEITLDGKFNRVEGVEEYQL